MTAGQRVLARIAGALGDLTQFELRLDEPMSRHTTLRLGGPADVWARPSDEPGLVALLGACHDAGVPTTFVGSGTNLLVRDGGLRGVVVNLGRLNRVERPEPEQAPNCLYGPPGLNRLHGRGPDLNRVEVEAGVSTGRLLLQATQWGLGGVEFLAGVPGSVGGGLIMNAGTYLGEFTNVVVEVRSLDLAGRRIVRGHAACGFRYRDSDLPSDEIVVSARLQLWPRDRAEIEADASALRRRRDEREPKGVPNNGSTFKNPVGEFAGRLIEAAGLKGARRGGAVVSEKHANWLVVDKQIQPGCTAADMLELIGFVRAEVERVHGVQLETEVEIVGDGP